MHDKQPIFTLNSSASCQNKKCRKTHLNILQNLLDFEKCYSCLCYSY